MPHSPTTHESASVMVNILCVLTLLFLGSVIYLQVTDLWKYVGN